MKEAVINEIILEMQSKADNGQLIELKSALERISPVIKVIVDKIQANEQENEKLVAIRDVLLPKLMSGEIDVSNVDISALTSTDKLSFTEE